MISLNANKSYSKNIVFGEIYFFDKIKSFKNLLPFYMHIGKLPTTLLICGENVAVFSKDELYPPKFVFAFPDFLKTLKNFCRSQNSIGAS